MIKKACFLLVGLMLLPNPARADDLYDPLTQVWVATGELLQCNSPHLDIAYENCNNYLNYYSLENDYSHQDVNYDATVDVGDGYPCKYNKYVTDVEGGNAIWQAYVVACGIQKGIRPEVGWTLGGVELDENLASDAASYYDYINGFITSPTFIKIKRRGSRATIHYNLNPFLSEVKLEKKVNGHWVEKYDKIMGTVYGDSDKVKGRGLYRLTVTRFDGVISYRKKFRV